MTIELSEVQKLSVRSEAVFGQDETADLPGYTDIPFHSGTLVWTTDREMLDPMTAHQRVDAADAKIPGWRRGTLSMTMNLAATGVPAGDGIEAVQSALGLLLRIGMGGESLQTGDIISAVADAANFTQVGLNQLAFPGTAIGIPRTTDAKYEMRVEASQPGEGEHSMKMEYSELPVATNPAYASATYYLTQNPIESAQFIAEGAEEDDGWLLVGCQLDSMTIDTPLGQIPTITFTWKAAGYLMASETVGTIGAATTATYTNYVPIIAEGDFLVRRLPDGTTLPAPTCMATITINFGLTYAEVPCPSGVNGLQRWRRIRSIPVASGSYTAYYEDELAWTDRDDKVLRAITWQMGITPGESVMLEWPTTQIVDVQRVDNNSLASQAVSFEALEDQETTPASEFDLPNSAFRIHFG